MQIPTIHLKPLVVSATLMRAHLVRVKKRFEDGLVIQALGIIAMIITFYQRRYPGLTRIYKICGKYINLDPRAFLLISASGPAHLTTASIHHVNLPEVNQCLLLPNPSPPIPCQVPFPAAKVNLIAPDHILSYPANEDIKSCRCNKSTIPHAAAG